MINEILALIVSYLGVFVGVGLKQIAKKEVETGKKNLILIQFILFVLTIILFFYLIKTNIWYKLSAAIVLMIIIYITKNNYAVLGAIFGLEPSFLISMLIFLYGFPTGSLTKDNYIKTAKKTWIYLVLGVICLIIRKYLLI